MPKKNNLKITFDHLNETDSIGSWFEVDKKYAASRKAGYKKYKLAFESQTKLNQKNFFFMSYNKIVNFITKNAVIATIIMVLAVGGASTAAAQFFAPEEFKPSNLLFPNDNKSDDSKQTNVTNFEECSKQENAKILNTYPALCNFDGQTFTDEQFDGQTFTDEVDYATKFCESTNPALTIQVPQEWNCETQLNSQDNFLFTVSSNEVEMNFSNGGRGLYCTGEGCEVTEFYNDDRCKLDNYNSNGNLGEIFGTCVGIEGYISIKEKNSEFLNLSDEEITQIKAALNSIVSFEVVDPSDNQDDNPGIVSGKPPNTSNWHLSAFAG